MAAGRQDRFSAGGLTAPQLGEAADALRRYGPRFSTWALPFALVVYLGLEGGGYDAIVRSEVGIAIWWIVLLGAAVGVLPTAGLGRSGWIGLGLLAGFAAWTGLGIAWSGSSEASATEFARVATYLGVFALTLTSRRPGDMRRLVNGLAAGIVVIAGFALISRLHPEWFGSNQINEILTSTTNRLNYPLDYWNGLAALMAIAVPLLLLSATQARTLLGRAAAAAALPAVALVAFFTLSRGGAIEVGVGLAVFLALAPRRLAVLPSLLLAGVGSGILVVAATQRDALTDGLDSALAREQGDEMLAMVLIVCGGVALVHVALALAERYEIGPKLEVPSRTSVPAALLALACAVAVAGAVGLPGYLDDRWEDFKTPGGAGTGVSRFDSSSGSGRYQTWTSAGDANDADPLIGIGPGTFESWWSENGTLPVFVRDAHSLYMESLGELGIVGLLLIAGFMVTVLAVGGSRSLRGDPERRWPYAAATAGAATFAVAAGIDWAWELSVIPIAFMILAGGLLASRRDRSPSRGQGLLTRSLLAAFGVVAIAIIAIPMLAARSVESSQADARSGDLTAALDEAEHAGSLQPYAATPKLQQALVLELMGDFPAAASAVRAATRADSENWRTWLVLSRLEAERGRARASVAAYREARALNPRSPLFASG